MQVTSLFANSLSLRLGDNSYPLFWSKTRITPAEVPTKINSSNIATQVLMLFYCSKFLLMLSGPILILSHFISLNCSSSFRTYSTSKICLSCSHSWFVRSFHSTRSSKSFIVLVFYSFCSSYSYTLVCLILAYLFNTGCALGQFYIFCCSDSSLLDS